MSDPIRVVLPVTRHLTMTFRGDPCTTSEQFADIEEARAVGLREACFNGTTEITIVGADGALLSEYRRSDNKWRDLFRGRVVIASGKKSCTCGGVPTVAANMAYQYEQTMGWYWGCKRCGAHAWSKIQPPDIIDVPLGLDGGEL